LGAIVVASLLLGACYLYSASAVQSIEQVYPAEGRFVTVEGTRLHYTDKGRGDAIVLVHGASANLWDFEASIAPRLARTHRVVAFDRPGYGYSDRPDGRWVDPAHQARLLREALSELGVGHSILVGHSLGGAIVLAYALDYPDATGGIVLISGAAYPWKGGVAWTNHMATWPVLGSLFASTFVVPAANIMLEDAIEEVFAPNSPTPDYSERARVALALRPGPFRSSAEDVLRLSPYLEVQSQRYQNLSMPLMLISGKEDTIVPAWNHAHRLAALLPQARLVELERTGHTPHHVHPERVADLIAEFAR
jgi:pimeloyl-ACP methyl ester carboxylesterase